jgi:peroxiredoxin
VIEFWQERGYTFPVAMRSDKTRAAYGPIRGTPTLFLIDRDGTVRLARLGVMPDGALENAVKALLKRSSRRHPRSERKFVFECPAVTR